MCFFLLFIRIVVIFAPYYGINHCKVNTIFVISNTF